MILHLLEVAYTLQRSNGKTSAMSPNPVSNNPLDELLQNNQPTYGFLYYSNGSDYTTVQTQRARAMSILRDTLQLDLLWQDPIENAEFWILVSFCWLLSRLGKLF